MQTHIAKSYSSDFLSAKEVLAYFLLIIYLVATCKPVLPIAADILAHTFWESNHVESVHHQHGSQHVQSEITHAEDNDDNSQNDSTLKFSEPVPLHLAAILSFDFNFIAFRQSYLPSTSNSIFQTTLDRTYPPPKGC